ncbi:MAG: hypothetical protein WC579_01745 [Candidatus Paceibacterota bacterium]|jgi:hypothetical protein
MGNNKIIKILQNFWPRNKAKGLLAQSILAGVVEKNSFGPNSKNKFLPGCWLLAPKNLDFFKFRFSFFVHQSVISEKQIKSINCEELLGNFYRPFHAIAEFLNNAGIGVIYTVPFTKDGDLPYTEIEKRNFQNIGWIFFSFENGNFVIKNPIEFFKKWKGEKGRASYGGNWDKDVLENIRELDEKILVKLLLNELFYIGFIKSVLKKPLNDPYDVDSFLMSMSQRFIFPMEIKEKFAGENQHEKFFGIDAGRVMMLLRLCLPNDANAIYLIRELDDTGTFIDWKYITLSDIIMSASWNLQAGGPGMGGQSTQTIRLPYNYFKKFDESAISDGNLQIIGNMPKDIKNLARNFATEISQKFYK